MAETWSDAIAAESARAWPQVLHSYVWNPDAAASELLLFVLNLKSTVEEIRHLLTAWSLSSCTPGPDRHTPAEWSPLHSRTSPGRVCRDAAAGPERMLRWCCGCPQRLPGPVCRPMAPRSFLWGWGFWCRHTHTGRNHRRACKQPSKHATAHTNTGDGG